MQQASDKTFAFSFQYRGIIFQNGQVRNADLNVRMLLNVFAISSAIPKFHYSAVVI